MLLGPVQVHGALAHRLECALHPNRADIDMGQHNGDEQHRDHGVNDMRELHALDAGQIERKHQLIAGRRHEAAPNHNDPVDNLLTGIEAVGRRVVMANHPATAFEPTSTLFGMLPAIHIRKISMTPRVKGKLR